MTRENVDLKTIRDYLPHGAITIIAKKAGVLAPTVSRAMYGDKRSPKLPDIIKATAEYLAEYKAKEMQAAQAFNDVVNPETSEQLATRLQFQREKYGEGVSPIL